MIKQISADNSAAYNGNILVSIDTVPYNNKPAGAEIGNIRNRLSGKAAHRGIDIKALAEAIEQGHTIQGALLRDKQNENEDTDSRFFMQQLFAVDIDNDYKDKATRKKYKSPAALDTPAEIIERAHGAGLKPCIISESFSSGKQDENGDTIYKYHVLFAADSPIKDVQQSRQIINNLLSLFNADEACKDPARILFGTSKDKAVYYCPAVNAAAALLNCSPAPSAGAVLGAPAEPEPEPEKAKPKSSSQSSAAVRGGSMSDFTRDIKENKVDGDILLQMIDPNNLNYNEWLRVVSSYKLFGGSPEVFDVWNRQYTGQKANFKQDLAAFNKLTGHSAGKQVTKMTLHHFAEEHSPEEYTSYIRGLIAEHKRTAPRKRRSARQDFGNDQSTDEPAGAELFEEKPELVPLELPEGMKCPPNYIDFAFEDSKGKKTIVPQLLAENIRRSCKYIFVKGSDPAEQVRRFWYESGVYKPVNDEFIKNVLRSWIKPFGLSLCKKTYIEEAFYQLSIDDNFHSDTELNADENIINFKNGLLHLDTLQLTKHTPELLSTIQIPCNYTPQKTIEDAPTFSRFISRLANYDADSTRALIEFIGAAISNVDSAHYKKAVFLRGAGNCGKTQYISLISRLLSDRYYASSSLEELESRFGTYTLYGKRIVGDPDIKFIKVGELNKFKQATGGDPMRVEAKGKQQFTIRYKGFLLFGCNQLPLFGGDRGQWVYNRMLLINCGPSVTEQERDPLLLDKLYSEREAVVKIAIDALRDTINRKYRFTESAESEKLLRAYKIENDVVRQFIDECCELRTPDTRKDQFTQRIFFEAFKRWAHDCNIPRVPQIREFKRSLLEIAETDDTKLIEYKLHGGERFYIWTLTEDTKRELGYFDNSGAGNYNSTYNPY